MEETFPLKGIILGREPFRERDSKVSVYSRERGKQDLIARGTKRTASKLAGHIEPISLVNIMAIRGKRLNYLGSVLEYSSYRNIKHDLDKIHYTGAALRVFKDLIRAAAPDEDIFDLLKDYLDITEKEKPDKARLELSLYYFILKLLSLLGYKPELYYCVKCRRRITPGGNGFSLSGGGLVCRACQSGKNGLTISDNCVKLLRLVLNGNLAKIAPLKADKKTNQETINIISSFLQFHKT